MTHDASSAVTTLSVYVRSSAAELRHRRLVCSRTLIGCAMLAAPMLQLLLRLCHVLAVLRCRVPHPAGENQAPTLARASIVGVKHSSMGPGGPGLAVRLCARHSCCCLYARVQCTALPSDWAFLLCAPQPSSTWCC